MCGYCFVMMGSISSKQEWEHLPSLGLLAHGEMGVSQRESAVPMMANASSVWLLHYMLPSTDVTMECWCLQLMRELSFVALQLSLIHI